MASLQPAQPPGERERTIVLDTLVLQVTHFKVSKVGLVKGIFL